MSGLRGFSLIAGIADESSTGTFSVTSRLTGEPLAPLFSIATTEAVDRAATAAQTAFLDYRNTSAKDRASFLRKIAELLEAARTDIVHRATHESALPEPRINGELGRTTGQLKMFADILDAGTWCDPRIDVALPDRQPLPRPDVRSVMRPIGPVAVFGASNFPLAFSVAGGDTASALAAGCPVIAKAHPAHPGTSELVGSIIAQAVRECELPGGVFSLLIESGVEIGAALVRHPAIQAVGFTGSMRGGMALGAQIGLRAIPIPLYAEMSSINPVVVLPDKLATDASSFADGLKASVTLGVGQFCTNPGLVFTVGSNGFDAFIARLTEGLEAVSAGTMLTQGIGESYLVHAAELARIPGVNFVLNPNVAGAPGLFTTSSEAFLANAKMQTEVFGPSTLVVRCANIEEAIAAINSLHGQLTGSIFATTADLADAKLVADALESKVGRLIYNQFPTGVEVCSAMVHGGPYPSTSDSRWTSVGGRAINRWVRPVAYQGFPAELLPVALSS